MTRNDDGTYSQVGFIKDDSGAEIEYIKDKNGVILFEKGFSREKSGALPLQLEGIGKPLKDYILYGNTIGVGDKTDNLFHPEMVDLNASPRYYLTADGVEHENWTWYTTPFIPVSGNTVYLTGVQAESPAICWYDENKNYIGGQTYGGASEHIVKINGAKYVRFTLNAEQVNTAVLNYGCKIPFAITAADGSESITTAIYLNQPLYKIDGQADFISYKNQSITRYCSADEASVFLLDAPITETVELPEIPTLDGTTVIDVDTSVQPSEMQIKYKSKI